MSDSEYCNYEDVFDEARVPTRTQNKNQGYSDSEDTVVLEKPVPKKRKAIASKRSDTEEIKQKVPVVKKRKTTAGRSGDSGETKQKEKIVKKQGAPSTKTKPDKFDLFGIVSEEEAGQQTPCELQSVLTSRVANGTVTRRKLISGEFYVDVKVYKTADAISSSIDDRWKKVLTSLKIQINADGDEWKQLQNFFKTIHSSMSDAESVFYANKSF